MSKNVLSIFETQDKIDAQNVLSIFEVHEETGDNTSDHHHGHKPSIKGRVLDGDSQSNINEGKTTTTTTTTPFFKSWLVTKEKHPTTVMLVALVLTVFTLLLGLDLGIVNNWDWRTLVKAFYFSVIENIPGRKRPESDVKQQTPFAVCPLIAFR